MTKLPDEIENIVKKVSIKIWHLKNDNLPPLTAMEQFDTIIIEHLGKYLTIPTDEGIEKEETTDRIEKARKYYKENTKKYINPEDSFRKAILDNMPKEVKPPTKDTIEKIDRIDWDTMPDTIPNIYTAINKINELVDKSNHQQEQIQQLLSGK